MLAAKNSDTSPPVPVPVPVPQYPNMPTASERHADNWPDSQSLSTSKGGNVVMRELTIDDFVERALEQPNQPIYHYTSSSGMLGIMKAKPTQLWASEATALNDVTEVRNGWEFISAWLQTQDSTDPIIRAMRDTTEADFINKASGIYVLSSTTRNDDSQLWISYGEAGKGYALELDPVVPLLIRNSEIRPVDQVLPTGTFRIQLPIEVSRWYHVLYDDDKKRLALYQFAENARRIQANLANYLLDDETRDSEFQGHIAFGLATIARFFKSETLSGENEVRATIAMFGSESGSLQQFRNTNLGITTYIPVTAATELPIPDPPVVYQDDDISGLGLPVKSIIIGPQLKRDGQQRTVEGLCERANLHGVEIRKSKVPF